MVSTLSEERFPIKRNVGFLSPDSRDTDAGILNLRDNTDVRVVYPYDDLIDMKQSLGNVVLYHKTDTHWNELGGYIGVRKLLEELDIEIPNILGSEVELEEKKSNQSDLADMLNLGDYLDIGVEYSVVGYAKIENLELVKDEFFGEIIYRNKNSNAKKLLVCRDSFGTAMTRILASQFNESVFLHRNSYVESESIKEHNLDIVVYEVVERYIGELLNFKYE